MLKSNWCFMLRITLRTTYHGTLAYAVLLLLKFIRFYARSTMCPYHLLALQFIGEMRVRITYVCGTRSTLSVLPASHLATQSCI